MAEHPIALKLRRDIVPYLVSSDRLQRRPVYVAYFAYALLGDILAAVAGAGLSNPLLETLLGKGGPIAGGPTWLTPTAAVILAGWAALKFAATRNDGAKRATLMRSCRREVQRMRARLIQILGVPSPMPAVEAMQAEISALVDRHIVEGSWPWSPACPDADKLAIPEVDALVAKFGSGWEAPPRGGRVPPPATTEGGSHG